MTSSQSRKILRVAVVGGGQCSSQIAALAEKVGRELAGQGCVVVTGGLGGVMEAACKGAKSANGLTVGILPGFNAGDANEYVSIPIVTGLNHARNAIVVRSADAIIAINGQYGTLSEIALGLAIGIPVVGLKTWDISGLVSAKTAKEAVDRALELIGRI
ncbi:MAG: hypothetical protein AMJ92_00640 [candidate division Zixibacteria bacterium SM23_81]|nr:MAG: hypothetical protein AMJ92_00640 [candidate division Zixibacteria bacterium SM23_81]